MRNTKAYFAVVIAMLIWAFSFIWSKQALSTYDPLSVLSLRLLLASLLLFIIGFLTGRLNKIMRTDWKLFLVLSFWEPFLYFIGENYGLQRVSPTVASVMMASIPIFLPLVAWFSTREKITLTKTSGTILSFLGVFLVIINEKMELVADIWGILLLLMAVFSTLGYSVLVNKLAHKYNAYTIVSYQSLFGLLAFIPLFFTFEFHKTWETGFIWEAISPIIYLAVFGSSVAFILFTYSIKILGITRSGIFTNIIPVFTAFFSFAFYGERLLGINYLGIIIVVLGLYIAQLKFKKNTSVPL